MASPDDRWRCGYCERWYVVPVLARDCESKHEATMPDTELPRAD